MNKYVLTLAMVVIAFMGGILFAKNPTPEFPGMQPYTPTRLEWLVVVLNSRHRTEGTDYRLFYNAQNPDTVKYVIFYTKDLTAEKLIEAEKLGEAYIKGTAQSFGWENWVKAEKDILLLK